ncbi:hypothetical protein JCM5353_004874 [Sporobolomyces roseus]
MTQSDERTIAVIGASGNQGSGVVSSLLSSTSFNVVAISSNPSSTKAQALLASYVKESEEGRFKLVQGDLNNRRSIEKALEGCYGLFASFAMTAKDGEEDQESLEVNQGKMLIDVAKECGIKHFVYSSLPSADKLSHGRFKNVAHFESKAKIEEYAKEKLENVTILIPGAFLSNLENSMWAKVKDDGTLSICCPLQAETKVGWVDDRRDIGVFAAAILDRGPSVTKNKTYPVNASPLSNVEFAKLYTQISGDPAEFEPQTLEESHQVLSTAYGGAMADSLIEMFQFMDSIKHSSFAYGSGYIDGEQDTSSEDLEVKATSPEDYFKISGWRARGSEA